MLYVFGLESKQSVGYNEGCVARLSTLPEEIFQFVPIKRIAGIIQRSRLTFLCLRLSLVLLRSTVDTRNNGLHRCPKMWSVIWSESVKRTVIYYIQTKTVYLKKFVI